MAVSESEPPAGRVGQHCLRLAECRHTRRVAGIGSLGHPRFVGIAEWRGG